jgi:hypothetical protein
MMSKDSVVRRFARQEIPMDVLATGSSSSQRSAPAQLPATSAAKPATTATPISGLIDTLTLSDHAKAVLAKATADQEATADLTLSFDERLAKRSDALASKLTKAFQGLNVNLDESVRLKVD